MGDFHHGYHHHHHGHIDPQATGAHYKCDGVLQSIYPKQMFNSLSLAVYN